MTCPVNEARTGPSIGPLSQHAVHGLCPCKNSLGGKNGASWICQTFIGLEVQAKRKVQPAVRCWGTPGKRPQTADEALERPLPDNLSRILCEVADAGPGNDTYQCLDMPYQRLAHKKTTVVIV
ncbi:unnamed protein product [Effrenium voratum]|nr:unnamed protein product [Effrenium voratum]